MTNFVKSVCRWMWRRETTMAPVSVEALAPAQAKLVNLMSRLPHIYHFAPPVMRACYWLLEQPFSMDRMVMARIKDHWVCVDSKSGAKIKIRSYYPKGVVENHNAPALVYYHGGGCVIGSVSTHDILCRYVAEKTQQVVLSVDYRRSPEYKFPVPVEDAICAWNWVCDHSDVLGIDVSKTGIGGDSAGAYLATSVCLQKLDPALKHRPDSMPAYQWLLYPVVDWRFQTESCLASTEGMLLTYGFVRRLQSLYLNNISEASNPVVSPLLLDEYQGMPPMYLLTVGYDPLKDEGVSYAERMKASGCDVIYQHAPNSMHAFITVAGVCGEARKTLERSVQGLSSIMRFSMGLFEEKVV